MKSKLTRITAIVFFAISFAANGQIDLTKLVTIELERISLEKLFSTLELNLGVTIAYGSDEIPSDLRITIKARNKPFVEILQLISLKAHLSYKVIGSVIVFQHLGPTPRDVDIKHQSPRSVESQTSKAVKPLDSMHIIPDRREALSRDTQVPEMPLSKLQSTFGSECERPSPPEIKRRSTSPTVAENTRKKRMRPQAGVFLTYSVDFNQFEFNEPDIAFQVYRAQPNHCFAVGGYVLLWEKMHLSMEFGYATKNFSLEYNYKVLDQNDPFPVPHSTLAQPHYFEIPLSVGYRLFSRRAYSISLTTGFYLSVLVNNNEKTTYQNQAPKQTDFFLHSNRRTLSGGTLGLIFQRAIGSSWSLFINPAWLYSIAPVNGKAMHSNSSLFRVEAGIEFAFQRKKLTPLI